MSGSNRADNSADQWIEYGVRAGVEVAHGVHIDAFATGTAADDLDSVIHGGGDLLFEF